MNRPYPLYELPHADSLKHMIWRQATQKPDRVAFRFRQGKVIAQKTVAEFWNDVLAFGTWLEHEGIRQTHVALVAPNSYLWLVFYFAVINGSNVIVPIDKDLPAGELCQLLRLSDSTVVICADRIAPLLKDSGCRVISLKEAEAALKQGQEYLEAGETAYRDYEPDVSRMATIVFTSGTTGISKGVMLSQANILADINTGCRLFNPMGDSLSVLPFHHMFGLVVSLMMLFNWEVTAFINTSLRYLLPDFKECRPITTMLVPLHIETFYKMVMENAKKSGKYKKLRMAMKLGRFLKAIGIDVRRKLMHEVREAFGGKLEYIVVGGAVLDPFYEREFDAWGITLIVAYGATECSPGIACGRNHYLHSGSVGLPISANEVRIAPDGEVMIRGENVMSGYYHNEEATRDALRDGWYASGDIGYLDDDGFLYLTGRKKNLIILSDGENVSPEKLENGINRLEGVCETMVYEEDHAIVAEIFPEKEYLGKQEWFEEQVNKYNETLPPTQRIRKVKLRDVEFPKNTSRKILRYKVGKENDHV